MRRLYGLVIALAACGGGSPPPPVNPIDIRPPKPVEPPPAPACIPQPEEAAPIKNASGDANEVSYCIGTAIDQCFALELATGKLLKLREPRKVQDRAIAGGARVETTNPELKVCTGDMCKTLTPQVWPGAAPLRAATNGSVAAVMLGDAEAGKGYVEIFEVSKPKRVASFKYARGEFRCGEIAMLGDTIYVAASSCTNPTGRAALYSAKGKKLANVGGKADFGSYGGAYTQVEGTTWAFLDENGTRLAIQDVAKGKVLKMIDVSELFTVAASAKLGNPGEAAIVRAGIGKLAVIAGTPANGSVAIVDVTTGKLEVIRAPRCS